jgi:DHA2 family multidrug resistance protein
MEFSEGGGADTRSQVVEVGWRRLAIVVAVMSAALMETLDSTIVNVALPTIDGNLGASIDAGVWIVTGYIIANVVFIPLNPLLMRALGRRMYFTACIAGFTLASLLCSTAESLELLVAFRFVQGAFGGGLIATSQGVIRDTFPPNAVGTSSALFSIALIAGPALGPLAGGYLTDSLSWPWIFFVNLIPGVVACATLIALLRDPLPPQPTRIDWRGVTLLAAGFGAMQYGLDNGERLDWFDDARILGATIVAVAALALFARRQWVVPHPVVDLHVLGYRSVRVGLVLGFAFGAIVFAPAIVTPLYASSILGYTAWDSGTLLMVRALPVVLLTPPFAMLAQRGADVRYLLAGGFALTAISMKWLDASMTSSSPFGALALPLALSGVGQSMLLVPLIIGVLTTTPAQLNDKIAPLVTLAIQLGGSIGSAASIAFFDRRTSLHADVIAGTTTLSHLGATGITPTLAFLTQLAGVAYQQATTMGFADTLLAVGVVAALATPMVLLFPRSRPMT